MTKELLQFAAEEKTGLAVLGIDPVALLLQLVTFVILFLLLRKFAFKTIVRKLEERRRKIDDGIRLGREMEREKAQLEAKIADLLKKARVEADHIIAEAHEEAGSVLKQAEEAAVRKTEAMIADAEAHIDKSVRSAKAAMEEELLSLVAAASEAVIGEKLDPKKDNQLIERALKEARL